MRAVTVEAPGRLAVVEHAEPEPRPGQAMVAVESSGLCGTDVKILKGHVPVTYPRVLGHEVVGRVLEVGDGDGLTPGARVLIDPTSSCGRCLECRGDAVHLCASGGLMGRDTDGGLAERVAVDTARLHLVPDDLDARSAGLLQVLGTCVHAQSLVDAVPGQVAVVVGLGVAGMLQLQLLRARGLDVVGITRSAERRRLADDLGALATAHPDEAEALVSATTANRGAHLVIETAGVPTTLGLAVCLAAPGATVLVYGIHTRADGLPLYQLYVKELSLVSARAARPRDYARAIDLAASGRLDLPALWSATFPIDRADDAFRALDRRDVLKVTLGINRHEGRHP